MGMKQQVINLAVGSVSVLKEDTSYFKCWEDACFCICSVSVLKK